MSQPGQQVQWQPLLAESIMSKGGLEDDLLCDVWQEEVWCSITSLEIVHAVRRAAKALKLHDRGIDPDLVGSYSL